MVLFLLCWEEGPWLQKEHTVLHWNSRGCAPLGAISPIMRWGVVVGTGTAWLNWRQHLAFQPEKSRQRTRHLSLVKKTWVRWGSEEQVRDGITWADQQCGWACTENPPMVFLVATSAKVIHPFHLVAFAWGAAFTQGGAQHGQSQPISDVKWSPVSPQQVMECWWQLMETCRQELLGERLLGSVDACTFTWQHHGAIQGWVSWCETGSSRYGLKKKS